jgi:hypothetical protein
MPILNGSMSARRLLAMGPVPDPDLIADRLAEHRFRPFEDGLDTERIGFCDWRNPLIVPADPNWMSVDRWVLLGLRVDTRRVPGSTLKAHLDLKLSEWKTQRDRTFVPKEVKKELKDQVEAELLREAQPVTKLIEIAWDRKGGLVYAMGISAKQIGALSSYFAKCFNIDLKPFGPALVASKAHAPNALLGLDPLSLGWDEDAADDEADEALTFLGKEFMVWLWNKHLTEGGASGIEDDRSAVFLGNSIQFVASTGRAQEVSLKKGEPAESQAAFNALSKGLMPVKAKIRLLTGEAEGGGREWQMTYSGLTLDGGSIKLPPAPGKDDLDRASDRLGLLAEGLQFLDDRFMRFMRERMEEEDDLLDRLQAWAKAGAPDEITSQGDEETGEEAGAEVEA